jgi:hypothetical protein
MLTKAITAIQKEMQEIQKNTDLSASEKYSKEAKLSGEIQTLNREEAKYEAAAKASSSTANAKTASAQQTHTK